MKYLAFCCILCFSNWCYGQVDSLTRQKVKVQLFKTINDSSLGVHAKIDIYTELIKQDSSLFLTYFFRARDYEFINEFNKALTDYNRAISLFPQYSNAFLNRGLLKIKLGDTINGCKDLHQDWELGLRGRQDETNQTCGKCCGYTDIEEVIPQTANNFLKNIIEKITSNKGYQFGLTPEKVYKIQLTMNAKNLLLIEPIKDKLQKKFNHAQIDYLSDKNEYDHYYEIMVNVK